MIEKGPIEFSEKIKSGEGLDCDRFEENYVHLYNGMLLLEHISHMLLLIIYIIKSDVTLQYLSFYILEK